MPKFSLILAALLLVPVLAWAEALTVEEAKALAARGALTIIDVRLPVEWAATGLPEGAEGVALQDSLTHEVRSGFLDDVLRAVGGDKDRPIALIYARGNRSAFARDLLSAGGFTRVEHIGEGVLGGANGPGWLARGLLKTTAPSGRSPARAADDRAQAARWRPGPRRVNGELTFAR